MRRQTKPWAWWAAGPGVHLDVVQGAPARKITERALKGSRVLSGKHGRAGKRKEHSRRAWQGHGVFRAERDGELGIKRVCLLIFNRRRRQDMPLGKRPTTPVHSRIAKTKRKNRFRPGKNFGDWRETQKTCFASRGSQGYERGSFVCGKRDGLAGTESSRKRKIGRAQGPKPIPGSETRNSARRGDSSIGSVPRKTSGIKYFQYEWRILHIPRQDVARGYTARTRVFGVGKVVHGTGGKNIRSGVR